LIIFGIPDKIKIMALLNLNFVHPQYGTVFNADVDTAFTATELLNNLMLSGFIQENEGAYQLALREQIMQAGQPLITLEGLEESAVLRIISKSKDAKKLLKFYIKHPVNSIYAPVETSEDHKVGQLMNELLEKGFIESLEGAELFFNSIALDYEHKLNELPEAAYLELRLAAQKGSAAILMELTGTIAQIKTDNEIKLQQILDYLPPASAIPIDPERAINPTLDIYESVDTLMADVYLENNRGAAAKISLWSPIPIMLILMATILVLLISLLYAFGVIG
jgi:hypothetical protein